MLVCRLGPAVPAHSDAVSCLDWSGGRLASGGWDGRVRVWRCQEEGLLAPGDGLLELNLGTSNLLQAVTDSHQITFLNKMD